MKQKLVPNTYIKDSPLKFTFEFENKKFGIRMEPFKLIVHEIGGEDFCYITVKAYYDCVAVANNTLFWGERNGTVNGFDLVNKAYCLRRYINDEAEKYFQMQAAKYPGTFPPPSGDYTYLPEINLMNIVVSKLAISVLYAHENYVIAGDLSGSISVFDAKTFDLVKEYKVDGAVTRIEIKKGKIIVDYIKNARIASPYYLDSIEKVIETSFDF